MALHMPEAIEIVAARLASRARARRTGSLVVALSGIDGSGKGYTADRVHRALEHRGIHAALLHADDWLSPPRVRLGSPPTARHFYQHGFLFVAMFSEVLTPLRRSGRIDVSVVLGGQSGFLRRHAYRFAGIDVILIEGIFLLKRELLPSYDETIWIDCTFETALERALQRNQERLSPEQIQHDYRTIYFPAQDYHATKDAPRERARIIVLNDERLAAGRASARPRRQRQLETEGRTSCRDGAF